MISTSLIAALGHVIAFSLMITGFVRIAATIDWLEPCRSRLALGFTEIASGILAWVGTLAVVGGWL